MARFNDFNQNSKVQFNLLIELLDLLGFYIQKSISKPKVWLVVTVVGLGHQKGEGRSSKLCTDDYSHVQISISQK